MIRTPRAQDAPASIQQLINSGRYPEAIRACTSALALNPHSLTTRAMLGAALTRAGRPEEAITHLNQVCKQASKDANAARELASAYMHCGRLADAERTLDRAIKHAPNNPELLLARARWATLSGKPDLAKTLAIRVRRADARRPDAALALAGACEQIGSLNAIDEGLAAIAPLVGASALPARSRALVLFQLARLLEAKGEYARSIKSLHEANKLVRTPADLDQLESAVDRMLAAEDPASPHLDRAHRPRPVFIVGMPRTGSTLIERIIAAHPGADARGETGLLHRLLYNSPAITRVGQNYVVATHPHNLTDADVDAIRTEYFKRRSTADLITDKDLHNVFHLGLIARVFPEARVIRCARNPIDACFSCYSHHFMSGVPYAQSFEDLARFSRLEQRVWDHWSSALDIPMTEVSYEQLVNEPDRVEHEIIEFAGLAWHKNCAEPHRFAPASVTASTHQTRKPIYTSSVARADRFADALDDLRAALESPEPVAHRAPHQQFSESSGWVAQFPAVATSRRRG